MNCLVTRGVRFSCWYEGPMPAFHVVLHRSGDDWQPALPLEQQTRWPEHAAFMDALRDSGFVVLGGPLADERRVVLAVEAESAEDVRTVLAQDPWSGTHLVLASLEPWTLRVDARRRS
ncbi:MAG: hypothetical protein JWP24_2073 [Marmoricola sp.]|nr:hypothetical protein [Marmoricola sp.]